MLENKFETGVIKKELKLSNEYDEVFLDLFNELGLNNKDIPIEGNVRQGMIGNTDVVVLQGDNNDLIIESIRTDDSFRGQGSASIALEKIINSADKRKLNIKIKILPEGLSNEELNSDALRVFYEKRGFVFNQNSEGIRVFNSN